MRVLALLIFITSCKRAETPSFVVQNNENYAIQVMSLQKNDRDKAAFKVRIMPTQKVVDQAGAQLQNILWYETDSYFYLVQNNVDLQPELVQPVANGQRNCYEYIVLFGDEAPIPGNNENTDFVFDDWKITRQRYVIRF